MRTVEGDRWPRDRTSMSFEVAGFESVNLVMRIEAVEKWIDWMRWARRLPPSLTVRDMRTGQPIQWFEVIERWDTTDGPSTLAPE